MSDGYVMPGLVPGIHVLRVSSPPAAPVSHAAILRDARPWRALRMRAECAAPVSTSPDPTRPHP